MFDLFTDFVGVVVFDTITIAVYGCVEIPNDRDLVEIIDGVDCSSCIQKTCFEGIADNVLGSNDWWDVDPGLDSNDIGGADDDCDVVGDELVWHWNTSGTHTVIYHVTDDDGVRVSEILSIEVLNIPPIELLRLLPAGELPPVVEQLVERLQH